MIWANPGVRRVNFHKAVFEYAEARAQVRVEFDLHEELRGMRFEYPTLSSVYDELPFSVPQQEAGPSSRPMESPTSPEATRTKTQKGRKAEAGSYKSYLLYDKDNVKLCRHYRRRVATGPNVMARQRFWMYIS
ncbi:hypothetical protein CF326_g9950 [Tilletia indica]|nr:hypothetical protein CF326_g9950 [Tilletia indica]